MYHPINTLMICDKEEDRTILKSFLKQLNGLEIYEIYRLNSSESLLEIISELEIDLIFIDLREDSLKVVKNIKDKYEDMVIMLIDTLSVEEVNKFNGDDEIIDAYIKKPILNYVFKFKVENLINIIKIDRGTNLFFKEKSAINLFSKEIRSMKIFYYITNADDMMDFGGWFFDYYYTHAKTMTFKFHDLLEFLYRVISEILEKDSTTTIIIERAFEIAYINMVIPRHIKFKLKIIDEKIATYRENLNYKDGILSLRVKPEEDVKDEKLETKDIISTIETKEVNKKEDISIEINEIEIEKENEKIEERKKVIKDIFIKTEIEDSSEKEVVYIDEHDKELLRKSYVNKISAKEFLNELEEGEIENIYELADLNKEWIAIEETIESDNAFTTSTLHSLAIVLKSYSSAIGSFYTFIGLSHALLSLSNILNTLDVNNLNEKKTKKLSLFLNSLRSDLESWKINIFEEENTNDIHYLDSSLLSSCMSIESILGEAEVKDDECELELF